MITDFGRRAENIGLHSLWMGEHVVLFDEMEFGYPGSKDGRVPMPPNGGPLDPLTTFGFLAGATRTLRFGTGISIISQRNPVYTAKELTTLDWLSNGRMDFGVGLGWCKEEVIACGYRWEDRGQRSDEFLALVKSLWTDPVTQHEGKHFKVTGARMDPKPKQKPHIPITVGGHTNAGLRRAARYGAGWYGFNLDPAATATLLDKLEVALAAEGRSRDDFSIMVSPPYDVDADMIREYSDLGVDQVVIQIGSQKPDRIDQRLREIEELAKVVV